MKEAYHTSTWQTETENMRLLAVAIGLELRRQRKELGLTQYELSIQADMSPAALSTLESRRSLASIEKTLRVCRLLGLSFPDVWQRAESTLKTKAKSPPNWWETMTCVEDERIQNRYKRGKTLENKGFHPYKQRN